MVSSRATRDSYALKGFSHSDATRDSRPKVESDGDSDYAILDENRSEVQGVDTEITKTTRVSVTVNSKALAENRSDDWV